MDQGYLWTGEYLNHHFRIEYFPGRDSNNVCVSIRLPVAEEFLDAWCSTDEVGATMDRMVRKSPGASRPLVSNAKGTA